MKCFSNGEIVVIAPLRESNQTMDKTYHSKSLYIIVKKTCRKRLTAFIRTANKYNHASPDIIFTGELELGSWAKSRYAFRLVQK